MCTGRLAELGLTLPPVCPPLAGYVPAVQSGQHVYVSGQLPMVDGTLVASGKVGAEVTAEQAKELAQRCASTLSRRSTRWSASTGWPGW